MENKKPTLVLALTFYFVFTGIAGFIAQRIAFSSLFVTIVASVLSLLCAIGLYNLKRWGWQLTIFYLVIGIIYTISLNSPILHQQRIEQVSKQYENTINSISSGYRINDKDVSKEEYVAYQLERIESERRKKYNMLGMVPGVAVNFLILAYLSRRKVKNHFK